jgi:hypothetical protein
MILTDKVAHAAEVAGVSDVLMLIRQTSAPPTDREAVVRCHERFVCVQERSALFNAHKSLVSEGP